MIALFAEWCAEINSLSPLCPHGLLTCIQYTGAEVPGQPPYLIKSPIDYFSGTLHLYNSTALRYKHAWLLKGTGDGTVIGLLYACLRLLQQPLQWQNYNSGYTVDAQASFTLDWALRAGEDFVFFIFKIIPNTLICDYVITSKTAFPMKERFTRGSSVDYWQGNACVNREDVRLM